jgi:hypothetical protein
MERRCKLIFVETLIKVLPESVHNICNRWPMASLQVGNPLDLLLEQLPQLCTLMKSTKEKRCCFSRVVKSIAEWANSEWGMVREEGEERRTEEEVKEERTRGGGGMMSEVWWLGMWVI